MAVPTCKKCGAQHYNMQPCDESAERARVQRNLSQPVFRARPDAWRHDRLTTLVNVGPGVVGFRRGMDDGRATPAQQAALLRAAANGIATGDA